MRAGSFKTLLLGGFVLLGLATLRLAAIGEIPGVLFDADQKEFSPNAGTTNVPFAFNFTNFSGSELVINNVRASCGCTTLNLPPLPWKVGPGQSGKIEANMDVRGKSGLLMKSVSVEASTGVKHLILKVNLPDADPILTDMNDRIRNQQVAMTDRQAVFRGDCARCHVEPGREKLGPELFAAACSVCHDTPARAPMVPDLFALNKPTDANYWRTWIMFGREGSLMPAFVGERGGPLTPLQIESLVQYLSQKPLLRPAAPVSVVKPLAPSE